MTKEQATREALRMALEALEESHPEAYRHVITAIKEALQNNEQVEPVARLHITETDDYPDIEVEVLNGASLQPSMSPVNVYTTPPQRKPLTHEQRFDLLTKFEPHKNKWEAPAILIDMVEAAHGIKE